MKRSEFLSLGLFGAVAALLGRHSKAQVPDIIVPDAPPLLPDPPIITSGYSSTAFSGEYVTYRIEAVTFPNGSPTIAWYDNKGNLISGPSPL